MPKFKALKTSDKIFAMTDRNLETKIKVTTWMVLSLYRSTAWRLVTIVGRAARGSCAVCCRNNSLDMNAMIIPTLKTKKKKKQLYICISKEYFQSAFFFLVKCVSMTSCGKYSESMCRYWDASAGKCVDVGNWYV